MTNKKGAIFSKGRRSTVFVIDLTEKQVEDTRKAFPFCKIVALVGILLLITIVIIILPIKERNQTTSQTKTTSHWNTRSTEETPWRADYNCGPDFPLENGSEAECDPKTPFCCCSKQ